MGLMRDRRLEHNPIHSNLNSEAKDNPLAPSTQCVEAKDVQDPNMIRSRPEQNPLDHQLLG